MTPDAEKPEEEVKLDWARPEFLSTEHIASFLESQEIQRQVTADAGGRDAAVTIVDRILVEAARRLREYSGHW